LDTQIVNLSTKLDEVRRDKIKVDSTFEKINSKLPEVKCNISNFNLRTLSLILLFNWKNTALFFLFIVHFKTSHHHYCLKIIIYLIIISGTNKIFNYYKNLRKLIKPKILQIQSLQTIVVICTIEQINCCYKFNPHEIFHCLWMPQTLTVSLSTPMFLFYLSSAQKYLENVNSNFLV
jgi:hypothetical protein